MPGDAITRRQFLARSALSAATIAITSAAIAPNRVLGANDRLSIGVIGAGSRGTDLMKDLHRFDKELKVEITAVCDVWRPARERTAQMLKEWYGVNARLFSDYRELLAMDDIDGVIIATPDFSHAKILIDAIVAGKDAYCEKPMASELEDAKAVMDAAKNAKQVIQIGTQRRSEGRWKAAAKMVRSGILGTISRVEIGWNDCNPRWNRSYSDVKAEDVDWKSFLCGKPDRPFDPSRYRRWHFYRDYTNGTIALLGSHYLDVASWLMDDPLPASAVAHGGHYVWHDGREHEDTVYAIYEYPKGFMCRYLSGLGNSAESGLRIYGTNGMFSEATWTFTGTGGSGASVIKEPIKVEPEAGENHMRNWLECMRSRAVTNAPVETGYNHSVACILGYQALITGKKLKYLPALRRIVEV